MKSAEPYSALIPNYGAAKCIKPIHSQSKIKRYNQESVNL